MLLFLPLVRYQSHHERDGGRPTGAFRIFAQLSDWEWMHNRTYRSTIRPAKYSASSPTPPRIDE
jgi:hypothetical protein